MEAYDGPCFYFLIKTTWNTWSSDVFVEIFVFEEMQIYFVRHHSLLTEHMNELEIPGNQLALFPTDFQNQIISVIIGARPFPPIAALTPDKFPMNWLLFLSLVSNQAFYEVNVKVLFLILISLNHFFSVELEMFLSKF